MNRRFFSTAMLLFVAAASSHAQSYSIDWHSIDGGGGTSTGGAYSLAGGFWSAIATIQTPGAPLLTIGHTQASSIVVSWPRPGWIAPAEGVTDNGTNKIIIVKSTSREPFLPPFQTMNRLTAVKPH